MSVKVVVVVNKLMFHFNVDILFRLNFLKLKNIITFVCYIGECLYRIVVSRRKEVGDWFRLVIVYVKICALLLHYDRHEITS